MTTTILRLLLAVSLFPATLLAQAKPALAFDVATIKPSDPDNPNGSLMMSEGRFESRGITLLGLIRFAYELNMGSDQQVSGGPKWLGTAKFDIDAKEDEQTAAALKKMTREESTEHVRQMVVALLADRFSLQIHRETKTLPAYALVIAKGGPKMTPAIDPPLGPDGKPPRVGSGIRMAGRGELNGINATMPILVSVIARQPEAGGRVVLDQTGLPGKFNFTLKWTPESSSGAPEASSDSTAPSFLTALQEQLGLKLDPIHAPVDTIVVDNAKLPTAN